MSRAIVVLLVLSLTVVALVWVSRRGQGPEGTAGESIPLAVSWEAVDGADSYRVQAWSGHRLLLEESVRDTSMALAPSMVRTMAAFDSVSVEIRAEGERGVLSVQRQRLTP